MVTASEPRQCPPRDVAATHYEQPSHAQHYLTPDPRMSLKITIQPSGHTCAAEPEQSILQAALDAGYILPYGCRNGACGSCKGKILSGRIEQGSYQEGVLSEQDKLAGLALFCCAKALSDVTIECREVNAINDIPIKTLPCRVRRMERCAPDVMILYLQLPANERLQFLPGQYLDILLKDGRRRSFSMANAPHDDELLQLHVRLSPGGRFTEHVFTQMRERDILRFEGPHGTFYLREDSDKPILLVAGGTGLAPIKSIIEHAIHHKIRRSMTLYWGARSRVDLYLAGLPEAWQSLQEEFRYLPVLSEPKDTDNWRGRTGLVHQAVMQDYADLSRFQVYVCGAPAMVHAAKSDFTAHCGLPQHEFFSDAFAFASDSVSTT
jgi:CDP-4-dehydro-6-deoxyglucose reductase